jgi:hypothetical protein
VLDLHALVTQHCEGDMPGAGWDTSGPGCVLALSDKRQRSDNSDARPRPTTVPFLPHSPSGGRLASRSPHNGCVVLVTSGGLRLREGPRAGKFSSVLSSCSVVSLCGGLSGGIREGQVCG